MYQWQRTNRVLCVYGLLVSVSAFITVLVLFQIPSDPRNIIFRRPLFSALNCDTFAATFGPSLPSWETVLRMAMER